MEGVGLLEKAKADQKGTAGDKNGQNTKMEASDGSSRELRSYVDKRRARWENPVAGGSLMRPHEPTREGQLPKKHTRVTARGSLVVRVLASDG